MNEQNVITIFHMVQQNMYNKINNVSLIQICKQNRTDERFYDKSQN